MHATLDTTAAQAVHPATATLPRVGEPEALAALAAQRGLVAMLCSGPRVELRNAAGAYVGTLWFHSAPALHERN